MIVVDLGCCPHEGDVSIEPLIERFQPSVLYGFDPLLPGTVTYVVGRTNVILDRVAAWTHRGRIRLGVGAQSLLDATVVPDKNDRHEWDRSVSVRCFDFAEWLDSHAPAVVKMNIEGAEFPLLEHLVDTGADEFVTQLIVSWHDERLGGDFPERRRRLEAALRCPVEEWKLSCV